MAVLNMVSMCFMDSHWEEIRFSYGSEGIIFNRAWKISYPVCVAASADDIQGVLK